MIFYDDVVLIILCFIDLLILSSHFFIHGTFCFYLLPFLICISIVCILPSCLLYQVYMLIHRFYMSIRPFYKYLHQFCKQLFKYSTFLELVNRFYANTFKYCVLVNVDSIFSFQLVIYVLNFFRMKLF